MSKVPIIILAGNAGSGKDTIGSHLVEKYGAVCVAQADPMKRFAADVFGFSEEQLWGPSSSRNAPDERTVADKLAISHRFGGYTLRVPRDELFGQVIPSTVDQAFALRVLNHWFERIYHSLENGIPVSPRLALQTFGTEWGRRISPNMWNDHAATTCLKLVCGGFRYSRTEGLVEDKAQPGYAFGVITDGRFRNEIILTTMKGGVALRINRVNPDKAAVEAGGVKGHSSETELDKIPPHFFTAVIENNRDLSHLYSAVNFFMNRTYTVDSYANGCATRESFLKDLQVYSGIDWVLR
jgi:hypothetical protein